MTHKFLLSAALALLLPAFAGAQSGVRYTYTHTDGVEYTCSVYTDSIIILDATIGSTVNVIIPDSIAYSGVKRPVREVSVQAFTYSDIESVVIPNTVTEIGYSAFSDCGMLTTVTIGTGVRKIWEQAFAYCSALTTLNYNASNAVMETWSGSGAFDDCNALATLNIGPEVQSLPEDLVASVYPLVSLANVNIAADRFLPIASGYFGSSVSGVAVHVPCAQLAAYQASTAWTALGTVSADCPSDSSSSDTTQTSITDTIHVTVYDTTHVTDTTHITVYDTTHVTVYDTTQGTDTTHVTVFDTTHVTVYDTTHLTLYDTVAVHIDTVYCDTLIVHDTVTIHDTVRVSISTADGNPLTVSYNSGTLYIGGASHDEPVEILDLQGRRMAAFRAGETPMLLPQLTAGTYLVRVGNRPARKFVVAKR